MSDSLHGVLERSEKEPQMPQTRNLRNKPNHVTGWPIFIRAASPRENSKQSQFLRNEANREKGSEVDELHKHPRNRCLRKNYQTNPMNPGMKSRGLDTDKDSGIGFDFYQTNPCAQRRRFKDSRSRFNVVRKCGTNP